MSKFKCYKTKTGQLLVIGPDGIPASFEDISPDNPPKLIGEFEADGRSDFNWGVVGVVLDNDLFTSDLWDSAQQIQRDGL